MNCREIEHQLLLEGSDELSAARRMALERHVMTCAACQIRRNELARWSRFVRSTNGSGTPSDALVARVLAVAASERPNRPLIPFPVWRAALAAAAALVIMVGFARLTVLRPADTTPIQTGAARLVEVSSLLGMLMEPDQDAADAHAAMIKGDLQGFARQLLILEGLNADVAEEPVDDVSRLEGRQPTTLQWHSTPELLSERCV